MNFQQTALIRILVAQPEQGSFQAVPDRFKQGFIACRDVVEVMPDDVPEIIIDAARVGCIDNGRTAACFAKPATVRDQGGVCDIGNANIVRQLAQW